jgi:hypothetical protein
MQAMDFFELLNAAKGTIFYANDNHIVFADSYFDLQKTRRVSETG